MFPDKDILENCLFNSEILMEQECLKEGRSDAKWDEGKFFLKSQMKTEYISTHVGAAYQHILCVCVELCDFLILCYNSCHQNEQGYSVLFPIFGKNYSVSRPISML